MTQSRAPQESFTVKNGKLIISNNLNTVSKTALKVMLVTNPRITDIEIPTFFTHDDVALLKEALPKEQKFQITLSNVTASVAEALLKDSASNISSLTLNMNSNEAIEKICFYLNTNSNINNLNLSGFTVEAVKILSQKLNQKNYIKKLQLSACSLNSLTYLLSSETFKNITHLSLSDFTASTLDKIIDFFKTTSFNINPIVSINKIGLSSEEWVFYKNQFTNIRQLTIDAASQKNTSSSTATATSSTSTVSSNPASATTSNATAATLSDVEKRSIIVETDPTTAKRSRTQETNILPVAIQNQLLEYEAAKEKFTKTLDETIQIATKEFEGGLRQANTMQDKLATQTSTLARLQQRLATESDKKKSKQEELGQLDSKIEELISKTKTQESMLKDLCTKNANLVDDIIQGKKESAKLQAEAIKLLDLLATSEEQNTQLSRASIEKTETTSRLRRQIAELMRKTTSQTPSTSTQTGSDNPAIEASASLRKS